MRGARLIGLLWRGLLGFAFGALLLFFGFALCVVAVLCEPTPLFQAARRLHPWPSLLDARLFLTALGLAAWPIGVALAHHALRVRRPGL